MVGLEHSKKTAGSGYGWLFCNEGGDNGVGIQLQALLEECGRNRQGQTSENNHIQGNGKRVIHEKGEVKGR